MPRRTTYRADANTHTSCPNLNCNTLQQQNPSSQRRYQQTRDSREKPFKGNAPANRGGAKGYLEGIDTLYIVVARRWEATVPSQHTVATNEEATTHTKGPHHTHTVKEGSAVPTLNQGEVCGNHMKVRDCQEKTHNSQQNSMAYTYNQG